MQIQNITHRVLGDIVFLLFKGTLGRYVHCKTKIE